MSAYKPSKLLIDCIKRLHYGKSIENIISVCLHCYTVHENGVSDSFLLGHDVPGERVPSHSCELKSHVVARLVSEGVYVENNHHRKNCRIYQIDVVNACEVEEFTVDRHGVANVPIITLIPSYV